ncbi:MAG: type II toxin-antitoxin system VapC family toxin [Verrucomicrobia bacterium]|nr:type II toxin-antitoxin system VapC family toxin [Verrucomicrobiota bacterium]
MGLLIDTSVLIGFERGDADLSAYIRGREDEETFLSVISASELLHGVHRAKNAKTSARRLAFVEGVISAIPILEIDLSAARSHAQLWSDLARRGRMIGFHDSWLAATCLAHGLRLATGNIREFKKIPGLDVEEWT